MPLAPTQRSYDRAKASSGRRDPAGSGAGARKRPSRLGRADGPAPDGRPSRRRRPPARGPPPARGAAPPAPLRSSPEGAARRGLRGVLPELGRPLRGRPSLPPLESGRPQGLNAWSRWALRTASGAIVGSGRCSASGDSSRAAAGASGARARPARRARRRGRGLRHQGHPADCRQGRPGPGGVSVAGAFRGARPPPPWGASRRRGMPRVRRPARRRDRHVRARRRSAAAWRGVDGFRRPAGAARATVRRLPSPRAPREDLWFGERVSG
jgi:hypothetical protein